MQPEPSRSIPALVEQLSRLFHSTGYARGLYPGQWTALRFFAEAPERERTSARLARHQGMSLGPVSRSVRTLAAKGLVVRGRPGEPVTVTASGHALLTHDPRRRLTGLVEALPEPQQETLEEALETLIHGLRAEPPA
ncbi:MAG: MarR family transcriptional regulator [Azospirillum sp.]|nr:MarR family transcriptional regulator [Azospirillum sp.]